MNVVANFEDKRAVKCSFCGKSQETVRRIIAGPGVYICNECVDLCSSIVEDDYEEENEKESVVIEKVPSPKEIKAFLDEYVISHFGI